MPNISLLSFVRRITLIVCLASSSLAHAAGSNLNFKNADIRNVIEAVSKITGKNFLVDPRVSGRVTLVSSSEMDPKALYGVFLSILKIHGFIATEIDNDIVKIIPNSELRTEANINKNQIRGAGDEVIMSIIEIKNAQATAMISILRPLISRNGHLVAHADSNNLLVSDTRKNIKKLKEIIKKIDNANESKLHILPLYNSSAVVMTQTLTNMFKTKNNQNNKLQISAEKRTNSLLIRGSKNKFNEIKRIVEKLDIAQSVTGGFTVIKINHGKAKNIANVVKSLTSKAATGKATPANNINIINDKIQISFDEKANSIVLVGSAESIKTVRSLIKKLDVPQKQVLVEVIIVEVNAEKSTQFGLQWGSSLLLNSGAIASTISDASKVSTITGTGDNAITTDEPSVSYQDAFKFSILSEMLGANSNAKTNLLSAPSILTLENEEAVIEVGQEVPFITSTSVANTGGGSMQNISRKSVGIKLKITPQVNDDNQIMLDINQEISGVLPSAQAQSNASDIVTSKRLIKTNVLVTNENILVLGGLIDDHVLEGERPTTFISQIPIFGKPFRQEAASKSKRNLMIFIRPTIIKDNAAGVELSKEKYQYMRELQLKKAKEGVSLMPNEQQPVLDIY